MAVLTQFFVAAFSSFLMVGLVALYDPDSAPAREPLQVAYVGPGSGFDHVLMQAPDVRLVPADHDTALLLFRAGLVDAVIQETAPDPNATRTLTLLLPDGEIRTTLMVSKLKAILRDYERDLREAREDRITTTIVHVEAPPRANPYYAFAYSILLPLLIATPVFLAGAIAADGLTHELQHGTLHVLRSAPVGPGHILVGKLLTPVFLAPAQAGLWMILLTANGAPVHNAIPLLVLTTSLALLFATASAILALLVRRQGETQLAYSLLVLLAFTASLLLPTTPINLIAVLAIGSADAAGALTTLLYLLVALALLAAAYALVRRRLPMQPT